MKILLTGFTPFPGVEVNPAQFVVEQVAEQMQGETVELIAEVLPTAFVAAGERIRQLIWEIQPDVVISLGVAAGRDAISLERFALNVNDADKPDNDGHTASGQSIVENGPAAYRSTLPLDALYQALSERNIPVKFSNHAGAYVCNHVFYVARHTVEQMDVPALCGFIHIPMHTEAEGQPGAEVGLPIATLVEAIMDCIAVISCANSAP